MSTVDNIKAQLESTTNLEHIEVSATSSGQYIVLYTDPLTKADGVFLYTPEESLEERQGALITSKPARRRTSTRRTAKPKEDGGTK